LGSIAVVAVAMKPPKFGFAPKVGAERYPWSALRGANLL